MKNYLEVLLNIVLRINYTKLGFIYKIIINYFQDEIHERKNY